MPETQRILSGDELGSLICKALGLPLDHITGIEIIVHASGSAELIINTVADDALGEIDWKNALEGVAATVKFEHWYAGEVVSDT